MRKKLALGAVALVALLAFGVLGGGRMAPDQASAVVTNPIQGFDIDVLVCLANNPGNTPDPLAPAPGFPKGACPAEDLGLGNTPTESTTIYLGPGNRLGYPYTYHGPGWRIAADADITDGTQVGDVKSQIDLGCDGIADVMADSSNTPPVAVNSPATVAEQFNDQTTAWDPIPDEAFLTTRLPGAALASRLSRMRADIDTIFLLGVVKYTLPNVTPLNNPTLTLNFGPGARATTTILGGEPAAPSPALLCIQAGQESVSNIYGTAGSTVVRGNPVGVGDSNSDGIDDASGIYALWATEISAPDIRTGAVSFVLVTDCKVIGTGTHTDADSDCLEDADSPGLQPGRPVDTDSTKWDVDGDGLPDGIEVAWGSSPAFVQLPGTELTAMAGPFSPGDTGVTLAVDTSAGVAVGNRVDVLASGGVWASIAVTGTTATTITGDVEATSSGGSVGPFSTGDRVLLQPGITVVRPSGTVTVYAGDSANMDQDQRTDLEEHMGPAEFLSNPLNWDTDGDGVQDGGLRADCNKDGAPDSMTTDVSGGRRRVTVQICTTPSPSGDDNANKTPFGPRGARLTGNTDGTHPLASAVGDNCPSIPNPGQENLDLIPIYRDRLPADDVTNPHKDYYGDACDEDDDGDGFNDGAEARFVYDPGTAGPPAVAPACHLDGDASDADGTVNGSWTPLDGHSGPIAVTPLKVTDLINGNLVSVPDSDYDGTLDGVECELWKAGSGGIPEGSSNPASASVKPSACSAIGDIDNDTDGLCVPGGTHSNVETYFRTQGIMTTSGLNNNPDEDTNQPGDNDADSDNDGIADGVEAKGWFGESGPGASSVDSDRDGCQDFVQIGSIDGNRAVATSDAVTIVKATISGALPGVTLPLHNQEKHILDIDRNGLVNTSDAVVVAKLTATTCSIYW